MLVLSRHADETIMIGDGIEITIVEIKGDRVKIGISAPNSVPVHRKEIYLAIRAENVAASEAESGAILAAGNLLAGREKA